MVEYRTDSKGKWKIEKKEKCNVEFLIEPSQEFLDEQAAEKAAAIAAEDKKLADFSLLTDEEKINKIAKKVGLAK